MTFMRIPALLLVTLLVPAAASAQGSGPITNAQIFDSLDVREGATICEMGAGDGELTLAAARLVGSQGRVYASELGDDRVKTLRAKVADSTLAQITVVAGDPVKTNFPDADATRCSCGTSTIISPTLSPSTRRLRRRSSQVGD